MQRTSTGSALPDMQLLLLNLRAHEVCLTLLRMEFKEEEVVPSQVPLRTAVQAAYRLLRAMTLGLAPVQMEVGQSLPLFVRHAAARLKAHDVSPTGLISAIHRGNRSVCEQASEELITHFVAFAANEHMPRFLRFLRMLACPEGRKEPPVARNQSLIMQALRSNDAALLLLWNDPDHIRERKELIEADRALEKGQEGDPTLKYHSFLVALICDCACGLNATAEMLVRELVPLADLMRHLVLPELPVALRADYLGAPRPAPHEDPRPRATTTCDA